MEPNEQESIVSPSTSPAIVRLADLYALIRSEAARVIVGQDDAFELLTIALLTGGHVLLEGVPGTAKTLMAKTLALLIDTTFTRVQFTPDLMPSDIVGTNVFDLSSSSFSLRKGPVFTNVLLADEINRAPAKTQSALLEAMEEHQVTIDGIGHKLDEPFFVVATQNPVEYQGTYPLPEAQLDRFLFKIAVDYPTYDDEVAILHQHHSGFSALDIKAAGIHAVVTSGDLAEGKKVIQQVTVDDTIVTYITNIARESRQSSDLILGASPRATIAILRASKTMAAIRGRSFVTPDDVQAIAKPALRHRLILRAEAEIEGRTPDSVVDNVISRVTVPR